MKNTISILIITLSLLSSLACAQEVQSESKFTYLTKDIFLSKMDDSSIDFHVLYSYGYWCKECVITLPKLMSLLDSSSRVTFYPLIVDKSDSIYVERNIKGLNKVRNF